MQPSHIFSICHHLGQGKSGVSRSSHYVKRLWDGVAWNSVARVKTMPFASVIKYDHQEVFPSLKGIFHKLQDQTSRKCLQDQHLYIGGDHSIAVATLANSLSRVKNPAELKVVWLDAHADMNTYGESGTKNVHGMPLAYATYLDRHPAFESMFTENKRLHFDNLLYIGLRDVDSYEKSVIEQHNIKCISSEEVNTNPKLVCERILDFTNGSTTHFSIDVDSIDPYFLSGTGTPVDNGIHIEPLTRMLCMLRRRKWYENVIAMDIVETNFELISEGKYERDKETLVKLFESLQL